MTPKLERTVLKLVRPRLYFFEKKHTFSSMLIIRGKGNEDSFHSCSHGAGRTMSRTQAKATITLIQHKKATEGVNCRKDEKVLDESPAAYKNIESVMQAQSDLVEIVHTLKQVVCVKG